MKPILFDEAADQEFQLLIGEMVASNEFDRMKKYTQHRKGTAYDHSLEVAKSCFLFCKRHQIKLDLEAMVRGALLHDFFLYDRHNKEAPDYKPINGIRHLLTHPTRAWENAKSKYPSLSKAEKDIITKHMFPLTIIPPMTKAGWLVCFFDKVIALRDYLQPNSK